MNRSIATVLIVLLLAVSASARQQGEQEQTADQARLESVEVLVDAVVLDKDKRPVAGLTADDFEVLEDGKPQPITRVRAVAGPVAADPSPNSVAPASAGTATYHTIVVTDGTVQDVNLVDVRAAIEKYVRTRMASDDYVALFTIGTGGLRLLQPTTNDKEALIAAVANARDGGIGSMRAAERAGIDLARVQLPSDAYSTNVEPGAEEGVTASDSGGLAAAAPAERPDAREISLRLARVAIEQAEELQALGTSWTIYDALTALIDAHRVLPGRRSITIFSEGFLQVRQADQVKEKVLNAASAAGVTLYIVDARGLAAESDRAATSRSGIDEKQNAAGLRGSDLNS